MRAALSVIKHFTRSPSCSWPCIHHVCQTPWNQTGSGCEGGGGPSCCLGTQLSAKHWSYDNPVSWSVSSTLILGFQSFRPFNFTADSCSIGFFWSEANICGETSKFLLISTTIQFFFLWTCCVLLSLHCTDYYKRTIIQQIWYWSCFSEEIKRKLLNPLNCPL